MFNYNIYRAPEAINADVLIRDGLYISHSLMNGAVQIVVPAPSLERLQAIAAACGAPTLLISALASPLAQTNAETVLNANLDALPADAIPPDCEADLLAVAEAIR